MRMAVLEISQAELARRVGVAQPTIFKLVHDQTYSSRHLVRVARELGTTPNYLTGETDDPDESAPPMPELDSEARELIDRFATLAPADRRALLQVARSMADGAAAYGTVQAPRLSFDAGPAKG